MTLEDLLWSAQSVSSKDFKNYLSPFHQTSEIVGLL